METASTTDGRSRGFRLYWPWVPHPTEVAAAAAFFGSPEASYVTGQHIGINGGMAMLEPNICACAAPRRGSYKERAGICVVALNSRSLSDRLALSRRYRLFCLLHPEDLLPTAVPGEIVPIEEENGSIAEK
jgi:hypothetical protein